jgi:hypothetical protein
MIAPLRAAYVPALERPCKLYGILAGHRPIDDSIIGPIIRVIYLEPPDEE